jgi:hypothetical protein
MMATYAISLICAIVVSIRVSNQKLKEVLMSLVTTLLLSIPAHVVDIQTRCSGHLEILESGEKRSWLSISTYCTSTSDIECWCRLMTTMRTMRTMRTQRTTIWRDRREVCPTPQNRFWTPRYEVSSFNSCLPRLSVVISSLWHTKRLHLCHSLTCTTSSPIRKSDKFLAACRE